MMHQIIFFALFLLVGKISSAEKTSNTAACIYESKHPIKALTFAGSALVALNKSKKPGSSMLVFNNATMKAAKEKLQKNPSKKVKRHKSLKFSDTIFSIAGNPYNDTEVAFCTNNSCVRIWDVENNKGKLAFAVPITGKKDPHAKSVVSYLPNGRDLIVSHENLFALWDIEEQGISKSINDTIKKYLWPVGTKKAVNYAVANEVPIQEVDGPKITFLTGLTLHSSNDGINLKKFSLCIGKEEK
ncbi:MAG TPA: hypothetical protein VEK38_01270, partial [Candidatus Bathyarchaeia archaeon]|nr:hypothetical protein [Candidatus Bathyarchaeia archaeon]